MKATVRNVSQLLDFVEQCKPFLMGTPYRIEFAKIKPWRSLDQNKKLHAMIGELAEHTGYTQEEMKDLVKTMFGPKKSIEIKGQVHTIVRGTSEYSVDECAAFIDRLYAFGAELDCPFTEQPEGL